MKVAGSMSLLFQATIYNEKRQVDIRFSTRGKGTTEKTTVTKTVEVEKEKQAKTVEDAHS